MDLRVQLRPFALLMRQRREDLKLTAEEVGTVAGFGQTWCTELETGKGMKNPSMRRLSIWTQAIDAQEFGVYVVIDGNYTAIPIFEADDEDLPDDEDSA